MRVNAPALVPQRRTNVLAVHTYFRARFVLPCADTGRRLSGAISICGTLPLCDTRIVCADMRTPEEKRIKSARTVAGFATTSSSFRDALTTTIPHIVRAQCNLGDLLVIWHLGELEGLPPSAVYPPQVWSERAFHSEVRKSDTSALAAIPSETLAWVARRVAAFECGCEQCVDWSIETPVSARLQGLHVLTHDALWFDLVLYALHTRRCGERHELLFVPEHM